jgi:hypothetical protein
MPKAVADVGTGSGCVCKRRMKLNYDGSLTICNQPVQVRTGSLLASLTKQDPDADDPGASLLAACPTFDGMWPPPPAAEVVKVSTCTRSLQ